MNIYSYHGIKPIIKKSAYIHPQAVIIGNVEIGEEVYIGPNAVLRGDWGKIIIKTFVAPKASTLPSLRPTLVEKKVPFTRGHNSPS